MATYYIDPSYVSGGDGTFATPFNNWSSVSWAAGNTYLQKEGTLFGGSITVGASGTAGNRIVLGTYDAVTGEQLRDHNRQAIVRSLTSPNDPILVSGYDYVTVAGMRLETRGGFPTAGVRFLNCSHAIAEYNTTESVPGSAGASYGIRFDNATGSGAARSNWIIRHNIINNTTGNGGIICVWSSTSGETVTNITVEHNIVQNIRFTSGNSAHGIQVIARAGSIYLDRAGLCAKSVKVNNNIVRNCAGYGILCKGWIAGGDFANEINYNRITNVGDGNIDVHCIGLQGVQDFTCIGNFVDTSFAYQFGITGTGVGIFIDTPTSDSRDGCDRGKVLRNYVHNTGIKANPANAEVGGAGIFTLAGRDIDVFGNVIVNCKNGIVTQAGSPAAGASARVNVQHNTILNSELNSVFTFGACDAVTVSNNNIVGSADGIYVQSITSPVTNYVELNNNVFVSGIAFSNGDLRDGTTRNSRTPDASNTTVNPLINTDGTLKSNSPLIGGSNFTKSLRDKTGGMYNSPPSVGAFEYIEPRVVSNSRQAR